MTDETIHVEAPVDIHVSPAAAPQPPLPGIVKPAGWERAWKTLAALAVVLIVGVVFLAQLTIFQGRRVDRAIISDLRAASADSIALQTCRALYAKAASDAQGDLLKAFTLITVSLANRDGNAATLIAEAAMVNERWDVAKTEQARYLNDSILPCPKKPDG